MSAQPASTAPEEEQGLKQDAIGFVDALVVGLASTAPAYSLAVVIGIAGVQAPAVLLTSFVPMTFITAAFYYMNRADQDVGVPLFIGAAVLALGLVLMILWRVAGPRGYFERRGFEALARDFTRGEPAEGLAETPAGRA